MLYPTPTSKSLLYRPYTPSIPHGTKSKELHHEPLECASLANDKINHSKKNLVKYKTATSHIDILGRKHFIVNRLI